MYLFFKRYFYEISCPATDVLHLQLCSIAFGQYCQEPGADLLQALLQLCAREVDK